VGGRKNSLGTLECSGRVEGRVKGGGWTEGHTGCCYGEITVTPGEDPHEGEKGRKGKTLQECAEQNVQRLFQRRGDKMERPGGGRKKGVNAVKRR